MSGFPNPKDFPKPSAKLTDNETTMLLSQHLTTKQMEDYKLIQYILSYLQCRSSGQASREAGVDAYTGRKWRSDPRVHGAIEALTVKAVMKYGYDATEVIERVKEIAGLDPIAFENPDGSFKTNMSQIDPESRRAIKKFKAKNIFGKDANGMDIVIGQLIEVELWDKLKASELLGREVNIFKETRKVEHDLTKNMAQVLLESSKRGEERKQLTERLVNEAIDVTPGVVVEETDRTKD